MTETLPQQSYFAIWLQTWLPIIFSGLILVVIAIQAYIYKKQWNAMQLQLEAMNRQADLMNTSLEESKKTRMLDSRPIIAAKNTDLAGKIFTRESGVTSITFINTGKTPAVNARLKITREFRAAPLPENAPTQQLDNPQQSNAIFAPGMETKVLMNTPLLNDEQLAAALENRTRYYIWGLAEYDDIFGNHYRTRFCVVSDVFHNEVHFVFCQNNNVFE